MSEQKAADGVHFDAERGLAAGLFGMAPLLLLYELAQFLSRHHDDKWRNSSEVLATRLFELLGAWAEPARGLLVLAIILSVTVVCLRRGAPLVPLFGRQLLQGGLCSLLLGPALVLLMVLLDHEVSAAEAPSSFQGLQALGYVSGAAWEELVFRVGVYGVLFLAARRLALFSGVADGGARWIAEFVGLVGSAALFAAFHLELFSSWLGAGGEEFRVPAFTFRFLAGILLGLLFRWRGPGVSAWSHGLFNLSLALGVSPGVLVS